MQFGVSFRIEMQIGYFWSLNAPYMQFEVPMSLSAFDMQIGVFRNLRAIEGSPTEPPRSLDED